jgi:hypothetical protein
MLAADDWAKGTERDFPDQASRAYYSNNIQNNSKQMRKHFNSLRSYQ